MNIILKPKESLYHSILIKAYKGDIAKVKRAMNQSINPWGMTMENKREKVCARCGDPFISKSSGKKYCGLQIIKGTCSNFMKYANLPKLS